MQYIRALFLDLDDTIFPSDIPYEAFSDLFDILDEVNDTIPGHELPNVKKELHTRTFGEVSKKYGFSPIMIRAYYNRMESLSFKFDIAPYSDYHIIKSLNLPKYLVTSGSRIIQQAKIDSLGIEDDFRSIRFDDPFEGSSGKHSIFKQLLDEISCDAAEALVIGDNPRSEIRAAKLLNIPYVHVNRECKSPYSPETRTINNFTQLKYFL